MLVTHAVRFLSGVNAQVALQGLQMAEASATGVTGVGLLARVDQDVGSEVSNLQPGRIVRSYYAPHLANVCLGNPLT